MLVTGAGRGIGRATARPRGRGGRVFGVSHADRARVGRSGGGDRGPCRPRSRISPAAPRWRRGVERLGGVDPRALRGGRHPSRARDLAPGRRGLGGHDGRQRVRGVRVARLLAARWWSARWGRIVIVSSTAGALWRAVVLRVLRRQARRRRPGARDRAGRRPVRRHLQRGASRLGSRDRHVGPRPRSSPPPGRASRGGGLGTREAGNRRGRVVRPDEVAARSPISSPRGRGRSTARRCGSRSGRFGERRERGARRDGARPHEPSGMRGPSTSRADGRISGIVPRGRERAAGRGDRRPRLLACPD